MLPLFGSVDAEKAPDALFQPSHLESFEKEHGRIEPGTIVLVRTGWGIYWPDKKQYLGDDTPGDAIVDHGPSEDFIAHQILMKADIPAFENVASMEQLPTRGALILALPMKIRGGSGGPLRIVAVPPPT